MKIAQHKYDPQMIEDDGLTDRFVDFMVFKFPNADYVEKRTTYFNWVERRRKIEEDLLFF